MVQNTCLRVIPRKGQESWVFIHHLWVLRLLSLALWPAMCAVIFLWVWGEDPSAMMQMPAVGSLGSTPTGSKDKGRAMTVFVTVHPLQLPQINLHTTLSFKSHHCFLMAVVSHNLFKKRRHRRGRETSYRPLCCSWCWDWLMLTIFLLYHPF